MSPEDMQARYLRGEKVPDIALAAKTSRTRVYYQLDKLGTLMRKQGPETATPIADEIFNDLMKGPMTLDNLQDWLGEKRPQVIHGLLVLLRSNRIAVMRVNTTPEPPTTQGVLL
jgi:hypothetical protein